MAAPDNSPHIKRVLHSYKSQAMNSLQGPGPRHIIEPCRGTFIEETASANCYYSHNKKVNLEAFTRNSPVLETCKKIDYYKTDAPVSQCKSNNNNNNNNNSNNKRSANAAASVLWHASPHHQPQQLSKSCNRGDSPVLSPSQQHSLQCSSNNVSSENSGRNPTCSRNSGGNIVIVKNENEIYIPDDSETSLQQEQRAVVKSEPSTSDASPENENFKWVEPQVFLAPAPFPPQPLPVLASADPGVVPSHSRSETYLYGNAIACFTIGGEPRLCLPQILNTVLQSFSLTQINAVCDELQIFCSRCTPRQLEYLKDSGVLPSTATSCGLITKTDAQRLTHALLYAHISRPPPKKLMHAHDKSQQIRVSHNCFGKCKGTIWLDVYNSPSDPCIVCCECNNIFTTMQFVCHAHRAFENKTCHWGFDSENWRYYLMLSKDQVLPKHKAETELQNFKNKFDINISVNQKRKQGIDNSDEQAKKVRGGEGILYSNLGGYDAVLDNYLTWGAGSYSPKPPSWAVVPLVTKDGRSLPLPPAVFAKESIPSPVPSYLSQGPPILVDPGRVVPLSETEKFERNYQPNIALAPPKIRDKLSREAEDIQRIKTEPFDRLSPLNTPIVYRHCIEIAEKEPKCVKLERTECLEPELLKLKKIESFREREEQQQYFYVKMEVSPSSSPIPSTKPVPVSVTSSVIREPETGDNSEEVTFDGMPSGDDSTSERHGTGDMPPDLVLSTTDSDTESISSVTSKSEVVEEAEALLRGWTDRAAAQKVLGIVAALAKSSLEKDKQTEMLSRQSLRLQRKIQSLQEKTRQHYRTREELQQSFQESSDKPVSVSTIKTEQLSTAE